ncbi:hypothetical protein [Streptomyces sp. NBC_00568]|uniref:hypothetical protein n=1 Tax=Streptomyces sp. NBC_00568 TaxID=2975779 RepID=UPI00224DB1B3|nr:hypothetical protein [Streptomyces sp. NBC_00568]MCX4993441.1 hypothetical protein [Streptomyces sp. NBC_00568]
MSTTTPPVQHRTRFFDHRVPALYGGKYTITTDQSINGLNTAPTLPPREQRFDVRGPRFAIAATDVHACYPLPGSTGTFAQVLPHITFDTPGVPWLYPMAGQDPSVPTMALMVFRAGELPGDLKAIGLADTCTVLNLLDGRSDEGEPLAGRPPRIDPDTLFRDEQDLVCRSIHVPADLFAALAPLPAEMGMLAHVREGGPPDATRGASPAPAEEDLKAVVVANRFPSFDGGPYVVHLVSLDGFADCLGPDGTVPDGGLRVVSMWSWVFESVPDEGLGFGDLAQKLVADTDLLRLRPEAPPSNPGPAEQVALDRLAAGATALPQRLASGERTFGFYRGPFTAAPAQPLPDPAENEERLHSVDEALVYLEQHGIYDNSYASAFALGRALALADPEFRTALLTFRKAARGAARRLLTHPQLAGRSIGAATAGMLTGTPSRDAFDQLLAGDRGTRLMTALNRAGEDIAAGRRRTPAARSATMAPLTAAGLHQALARSEVRDVLRQATALQLDPVRAWLDRLVTLEMVPFEHLVPDAGMLPQDSIRFFYVDPGWIRAAVDGALSIGVGQTLDEDLNDLARGIQDPPACGVLLHSDLVEGWPKTIYTAFRDDTPVEPMRTTQCGTHILLHLYPQVIDTFTLAEPPQGLHFGFGDLGTIQLRQISGDEIGMPLPGADGEFPRDPQDDRFTRFKRPGGLDVLNLGGAGDPLLPALSQAHGLDVPLSSAQFTLQMVKAPQLQTFARP